MPETQPRTAITNKEVLSTKQFVVRAEEPDRLRDPHEAIFIRSQEDWLSFRRRAIVFLFVSYGVILIATLAIFFFQGFKFKGFTIADSILDRLAIATIGEVAGLGGIVYGALFKKVNDAISKASSHGNRD